jgi:hypothetical protein
MSGYFFDFAKQNQKNNHSFKIFFGGVSRQRSFETASRRFFRVHGGPAARRAPFPGPIGFPSNFERIRPIIRLVATGVIEGLKRLFSSHFVPFFGQIAGLFSLKKAFKWKENSSFFPMC